MKNIHFELFASFCKVLANRLNTLVEVDTYEKYGWASICFMTDKFGGTYLQLHYDLANGEIAADYKTESEQEISSANQLIELVRTRRDDMLKKRDLNYICEMINSEY